MYAESDGDRLRRVAARNCEELPLRHRSNTTETHRPASRDSVWKYSCCSTSSTHHRPSSSRCVHGRTASAIAETSVGCLWPTSVQQCVVCACASRVSGQAIGCANATTNVIERSTFEIDSTTTLLHTADMTTTRKCRVVRWNRAPTPHSPEPGPHSSGTRRNPFTRQPPAVLTCREGPEDLPSLFRMVTVVLREPLTM